MGCPFSHVVIIWFESRTIGVFLHRFDGLPRTVHLPEIFTHIKCRAFSEVEEAHTHLIAILVFVLIDVEDVGAAGVQSHALLYLILGSLFLILELTLP